MLLDALLKQLAENPSMQLDLGEVALILATDEYPDFDLASYLQQLDQLAEPLQSILSGTLEDRVRTIAESLFIHAEFQGNESDYYNPENSYFNRVLDRKLGIPITLSILFISVARRLGLNVDGLGLPGHFLAIARDEVEDEAILIDPFHGGEILDPIDAEGLIQRVTGQPFILTPAALQPMPSALIIQRMLNNLKGIYVNREDYIRAARVISRLIQLNPEDGHQYRDLGLIYWQSDRFGPCLDALTQYLKLHPDATDLGEIEILIQRSKKEISRWN